MSWPLVLIIIWIAYCTAVAVCLGVQHLYGRWSDERPFRERVAASLRGR